MMTDIEMFYLKDHDFNIYVNKNTQSYNRTLEEEFQNVITVEYFKSLQKGGCNAKREDRGANNESSSTTTADGSC